MVYSGGVDSLLSLSSDLSKALMIYVSYFGVTLLCYCELFNGLQPFESNLTSNPFVD
jgi:hypothetical protein